jgi:hypothetical protein
LLESIGFDRETRSHGAALVYPSEELYLEFSGSAIVNELEFSDVTVQLHDSEDSAQQFAGWADDALSFVTHLIVDYGRQTVGQ